MECKIIAKTPNMLDVVYTAARTCYSKFSPIEILEKKIDKENKEALVCKVISSNHTSVCEHGVFTFAISGVSRSLLAQLTRHRIASYSVQSQRYVNFVDYVNTYKDKTELVDKLCVIPDDIKSDEAKLKCYIDACYASILEYGNLVEKGTRPEDARQVLPMSFKTNIVCTFNIRSLMNFMEERLCNKAQKEIRELAFKMRHAIIEEEEWLNPYLLPRCVKEKKCKESMPCGKQVKV